ncbi:hypothetical protein GCM10010207_86090 [Streptomyces atratus]|nr:hypothetical protein GCM10010207_86090 [Streptomyces atratus]
MEKWQLALDMLDETRSWGIEVPLAVADAGYGDAAAFRLGRTAGRPTAPCAVASYTACLAAAAAAQVHRRRRASAHRRAPGQLTKTAPKWIDYRTTDHARLEAIYARKIIPLRPGTALWRGQVATW